MKKILIKGGEVVNGERSYFADVLIGDGKILKVLEPSSEVECDEVVDASGLLVLPGLIDAHVHLREPGEEYKEGFESGSMAALHGGVTTVLDMPNNKPAILSCADLEAKRLLASGKMHVNYGFYMGFNGENLDEINSAENICAVKLYTTHSTGNMGVESEAVERLFEKSNKLIVVHAEDNRIVEENAEAVRAEYVDREVPPHLHSQIRSAEAAKVAVERVCGLAKKYTARLHVAHVSTAKEIEIVAKYKEEAAKVTCEVAPHHLFLCEDDYAALGNLLKVNPPVRSGDELAKLWKAIEDGRVDLIATDHAPHTLEEKYREFWEVPSGVPELDTLLPVMANAVNEGRLPMSQLVKLLCEQPAAVFGLKKKGFVAEGFDADLILVDMGVSQKVTREGILSKCGWSPYEGRVFKGGLVNVYVGGVLSFADGEVINELAGKEVLIS